MKRKLYRIFNVIFALLFVVILLGTIFDNQSQMWSAKIIPLVISFVLVGVFVVGIYTLFVKIITNNSTNEDRNINLKKEINIFSILIICIIGIEILCGVLLRTTGKSCDMIYMIDMAYNIAQNEQVPQYSIDYYTTYPNNDLTTYTLIQIYKIFAKLGINDKVAPGITLNIIMITAAIITFYFIIRKLYGNKKALLILGMIPLLTPIFLYIPIFYTDTLSMFFVVMVYYLYLMFKDERKKLSLKEQIIYFVLINIIAIIGIKIKPTVAIIVIAMYIDMLLSNMRFMLCLKYIILSVIILIFGNIAINYIMNSSGYFNVDVSKKNIPYTHWIMMGLSEQYTQMKETIYGVWCADDLLYTMDTKLKYYDNNMAYVIPSKLSYEQMNIRCCKRILERINQKGIKGIIEFEYKKLIQTWGDGTYYAPVKITEPAVIKDSILSEFFHYDGSKFNTYYYFSHGVQVMLILAVLISTVISIKKKESSDIDILRIAIFGLMLLLEIWETRSRYVLNYILVLAILGVPAIDYISEKCIKLIGKINLKK